MYVYYFYFFRISRSLLWPKTERASVPYVGLSTSESPIHTLSRHLALLFLVRHKWWSYVCAVDRWPTLLESGFLSEQVYMRSRGRCSLERRQSFLAMVIFRQNKSSLGRKKDSDIAFSRKSFVNILNVYQIILELRFRPKLARQARAYAIRLFCWQEP